MITQINVQEAYASNIIQLITSPYDGGVVCQIGEAWFYFDEDNAEYYDNPEEYKNDNPEEEIVRNIYQTLCDIYVDGETDECFMDDYLYYANYLKRYGIAVED